MHTEPHNLHGTGDTECCVHPVQSRHPHDFWRSVTDIPCPVEGCNQTVLWYEAGYAPGYRACMRHITGDKYDEASIQHRFMASGTAAQPVLIQDVDE